MADTKTQAGKHRNDPYGDIGTGKPNDNSAPPPIPAATVVLLRDNAIDDANGNQTELRVLMLRKTSKISFGGMWVFPGGKLDAADYPADGDIDQAAQNAAVRETMEEANLKLQPDDFVSFSHWTPPPTTPKRFSTWFFAAPSRTQSIQSVTRPRRDRFGAANLGVSVSPVKIRNDTRRLKRTRQPTTQALHDPFSETSRRRACCNVDRRCRLRHMGRRRQGRNASSYHAGRRVYF